MLNQGSQDIAIARLRVRGDKRTAESCARELAQASWPLQLPQNLHGAWVLVRELHIKASQSQMHQQVRQQGAQQLNHLLAQAVMASHASNSAAAVQFTSLAELLAFLLRDIALGQALGKWYWQRWHYAMHTSREQAIAQLLCEHIVEWPAVVEELAAIDQLRLLWHSMSSATAATLIMQLRRHYGITAPMLVTKALVEMTLEEQQLTRAAQRQLEQHARLFTFWFPALAHLSTEDKRWQLAALISGISYCPLLVVRSPIAVIKAFVRCCNRWQPLLPFSQTLTREVFAAQLGDRQLQQMSGELPLAAEQVSDSILLKSDTASLALKTPVKISQVFSDKSTFSSLQKISDLKNAADNWPRSPLTKAVQAQNLSQELDGSSESTWKTSAESAHFFTQMGGFFYLINALRPLLTAEFLAEKSLATGWSLLLDCAWLLAARANLELDPALLRFLAAAIHGDSLEDLARGSPSRTGQNLFAQLEEIFEQKSFWQEANNLLLCAAQVTANASHIDVFYSLDSVRLDIRLAGLDINPGWVPWLGRVVTFHYLDSAAFTSVHPAQQGDSYVQ